MNWDNIIIGVDLSEYLEFVNENKIDAKIKFKSAQHHILPAWAFPEYINLKINSWNSAHLYHKDHFKAHLLLAKAWPVNQNISAVNRILDGGRRVGKDDITEKDFDTYSKLMETMSLWCSERNKGKIVAKDKDGNICRVDKDDPRWIDGSLVGHNSGRIHPKEEIQRRAKSNSGNGTAAKDAKTGAMLGKIIKSDLRWETGEIVHPNKGVKKSEAFAKKCAERMKGYVPTIETRRKLSIAQTGKKSSPEVKLKMSKMMSDLRWINNGDIRNRVHSTEVDSYLSRGWKLGKLLDI